VPEQKDNAFRFADLSEYSAKDRLSIRALDLIFFALLKILGSITRFEVRGIENFDAIKAAGKMPIYVLWHDRIFLSTYFLRRRGIVVITSKSFDGEYIARFIQRFGFGAIRGSSSRGGARALVRMIKMMRSGHPMAFTLDGPRGPRYVVKPGPAMLAKKTGNPIMPFVAEPRKYWRVNSWDRLQIPRPFSRSLVIIGEPIYVDADAGEAEIEETLRLLQTSLDGLVAEAAQWSRDKN
jgi:lysophospholipid acyltransferase (LPLAT)-like uncharacterized protein